MDGVYEILTLTGLKIFLGCATFGPLFGVFRKVDICIILRVRSLRSNRLSIINKEERKRPAG
jgi:hypothetical protein